MKNNVATILNTVKASKIVNTIRTFTSKLIWIEDDVQKANQKYNAFFRSNEDSTKELRKKLYDPVYVQQLEKEVEEYKIKFSKMSLEERQIKYDRIMKFIKIRLEGFACIAVALKNSFIELDEFEKAVIQYNYYQEMKNDIMNYKGNDSTKELSKNLYDPVYVQQLEKEVEEYKTNFSKMSLREKQIKFHRIMESIQIRIDGFACIAVILKNSVTDFEEFEKATIQFNYYQEMKNDIMNYKAC